MPGLVLRNTNAHGSTCKHTCDVPDIVGVAETTVMMVAAAWCCATSEHMVRRGATRCNPKPKRVCILA